MRRKTLALITFTSLATLPASPLFAQDSPSASTATVVALTQRGNRLIRFQAGTPGSIESLTPVLGLQPGEFLVGIDFRPSTGELQGVGNSNRLYRIDPATGQATAIGAGSFATPLTGSILGFGVDFNPVPDRVRVVGASDQNLRLHPGTGAVAAVDTPLTYAAGDPNFGADPSVVDVAYTNPFAGATTTTLYGIDSGTNALVRQGSLGGTPVSPNSGQLFTVGALGVDTRELTGFDISAYGGALAALSVPGSVNSVLYSIHLDTGVATLIGAIGGIQVRDIAIAPPALPRIFGLTTDHRLVSFRPGAPDVILGSAPVTGLSAGETLLGIDFRPATGELVGVGSTSRLYRLDPLSGAAVAIGAAPLSTPLAGTEFGVDFNPVPDRLRIVADGGQNLRANPNTGALAGLDTPLAYAAGDPNAGVAPLVAACAYTNDFAGASTTTLFGIDTALDVLVRQGSPDGTPLSPNGGMLATIGALGASTTSLCGFDITPFGGAFASLTATGATASQLFTLHLGTGTATLVGTIAAGTPLRDFAIEPPAAPRILAVTSSNNLIAFAPGTPGSVSTPVAITGLQAGEQILGLDVRPATGTVLGLGSSSRLYSIDAATGVAAAIGAGPFTTALAGTVFGIDFNPAVDRVRIVSDAEQNLRANPNTGALAAVDAALAFASGDANFGANPAVAACAYTASFAGTFATTLFAIDTSLDVLVRQGSINGSPVSPNTGALSTVGALGLDAGALAGFDVTPLGGAFAVLTPQAGGPAQLHQLNLGTGAATLIGTIGSAEVLRGIAVR